MSDPGLERAVQRASLASRCLDGAAADLERAGGEFGIAAVVAAEFLAGESLKVQTFADALTRLGVSQSTQRTGETA
jgi:hypothetical protein